MKLLAMDGMADSSQDAFVGAMSLGDPTVSSVSSVKKDKLCLVCGDKALGYNFNAVSCESCKAFFRRNAHKTIRGRCEGKCDVNVESRSFCKRCRLQKCFTAGMRKDMILNEEQKKIRKQKIMFNKLRRQGQLPAEDLYSTSADEPMAHTMTLTTVSDMAGDVKIKSEQALSPGSVPSSSNLPSSSSSPASDSSVPTTTWTDSQEHMAWAIEQLSEVERDLVTELNFAMEDSAFLTTSSMTLRTMPSNPLEFVNVAEGFVRRVIKVAKNIASFKTLHKDDQISLLKGSVVDIMMLRSAVNYDPKTESWSLNTRECLSKKIPDSNPLALSIPTTPTETAACPSSSQPSMSPPSLSYASYLTSVALSSSSSSPPARLSFHPGFGPGSPPPGFIVGSSSPASPMSVSSSSGSPASMGSVGSGYSLQVISADILKSGSTESRQLFINYAKFIKSLMSSINGDLLVLKLLVMMSLFSADRSTLTERENVQTVQENYAGVLQSYTGLRFMEDRTLFARLVMKLTDLRNINEVHSKMLMSMKVDSIEPLLLEIFDL